MLPLGYMYKFVVERPDWLRAANVTDILSVSGCISKDFADYVQYWRHNGYWLFDSPSVIESLAAEHSLSLARARLLYYEAFEDEYEEGQKTWTPFSPEASLKTHVEAPVDKKLEGFDVVTFSAHTTPECSPLSCNSLAETIPTNGHCLLPTFEKAREAVEKGLFEDSEPGPYRIIAVYTMPDA